MACGGKTLVRNVSSGAVAAIAAWSSYSHMVHLALRYGERPEVAYALPFSVDGMLIVSTIVMVDDKRHGRRVRPMARLAFTIGVIASIAANIAAAHPTLGARLIDAWPAVALLLVVEMLARPPAAAPPGRAARPGASGTSRHGTATFACGGGSTYPQGSAAGGGGSSTGGSAAHRSSTAPPGSAARRGGNSAGGSAPH